MALGLALALGCALAWGAFDAWRKRLSVVLPAMPLVVLLSLGQVPFFAGWAWLSGARIASEAYWAPGLGSVALNVVGNLAFMHAIGVSPLSLTIPLLAFVPVFTTGLALLVLGEVPGLGQWLGIGLVVLGAGLLDTDPHRSGGWRGRLGALRREPGTLPMLLTAAAWAGTLVLDKRALAHAHPALHGLVIVAAMAVVIGAVLAVRGQLGQLRAVRRVGGPFVVALGTGVVAMVVQLLAIPLVMLAALEAIKRAVGLVTAVALGRLMFGEPVTGPKVMAVVAMGLGAAAVLLGGATI